MSRITAPVAKLTRALSSTTAVRAPNPLLDTSAHNAGAVLMPKYAELLRNRRSTIDMAEVCFLSKSSQLICKLLTGIM